MQEATTPGETSPPEETGAAPPPIEIGGNWFILIAALPAFCLMTVALGLIVHQFFLAPPLLPQPPSGFSAPR